MSFFSQALLNGQNQYLITRDVYRALGPAMTPRAAQNANFILSGGRATTWDEAYQRIFSEVNTDFDAAEAIEAIRSWGVTIDRDIFNDLADGLKRANGLTQEFIRIGRTAAGESVFTSMPIMKQITEQLDLSIKTLNRTADTGSEISNFHIPQVENLLRGWRTSVTRGYFVPRATYFSMQLTGDAGQLTLTEGLLKARRDLDGTLYFTGALPTTFQNAFTYVPFFGPRITRFLENLGEAATQQGLPALTTPLNAMINPFVSDILTLKNPDQLYRVRDGKLSASQLLGEMSERNVFDALYSEDMRKVAADLTKQLTRKGRPAANILGKLEKASKWWSDASEVLVRQTQDHMRASVYLDYRLRRGASADEAQKAVEAALYDWRHGVTEFEMTYLTPFAAFYPYFRLSMQQMASALMEPLTWSAKETVKHSILGTSKLGQLRGAGRAYIHGIPAYVNNNDGEDLGYAEATQVAAALYRPEYYGARPVLASEITSEGTSQLRIGSSTGVLETLELYSYMLTAMAGVAATSLGNEDIVFSEDVQKMLVDGLVIDQLNPIARDFAEGWYNRQTGERSSPLVRLPRKYEELGPALRRMPLVGETMVKNKYDGSWMIPRTYLNMLMLAPFFGSEVPRLLKTAAQTNGAVFGTAEEARWDIGSARGIAWMFSDMTGLTRQVDMPSVAEIQDIRARKIRGSASDVVREARSRAEGIQNFPETD